MRERSDILSALVRHGAPVANGGLFRVRRLGRHLPASLQAGNRIQPSAQGSNLALARGLFARSGRQYDLPVFRRQYAPISALAPVGRLAQTLRTRPGLLAQTLSKKRELTVPARLEWAGRKGVTPRVPHAATRHPIQTGSVRLSRPPRGPFFP